MLSQSLLRLSLLIHLLFLSSSLFLVIRLAQASPTDTSWTTGSPIPTARSEIAGTVLNGKIYIIGGFDETGRSSSTVEVYDPSTDEWINSTNIITSAIASSVVAPLPQPLDHAAAASHNGKLYVIGGGYLDRGDLSNKLFIYDPNNNEWTEGEDLPSARGALTANFINGTLAFLNI